MPIQCFLIDDDIDDQDIFSWALEEVDKTINLIKANDGQHALEMFVKDENFIPDFIFLDLNMPRVNGKQCLTEIKKNPRLKNVPVIIYTTSSNVADIKETESLGASLFITKTTDLSDLVRLLSEVFTFNLIK